MEETQHAALSEERGKILNIYHININCRDLDRSEAFYEQLGFRTVARFSERCANIDRGLGFNDRQTPTKSRAVFMKLGLGKGVPETVLDLCEWQDPAAEGDASGLLNYGVPRIALRVDDIDAIVAKLETRGIDFFSEPQTISTLERKPRFACFRDPDGVILELVQP